jgi:hypothetical protein
MARTAAGRQLTEAHQAAQLALRAGSLRRLVELWQLVDPVDLSGTINVFARAAAILTGQGVDQSAGLALNYYGLFRRAEGVPGTAPAMRLPVRQTQEELAASLRGAGLKGIIDARRAGLGVEQSKSRGLIRVIGAVTKLILTGGRRAIITATEADRQALGFQRVTSGDPCAFCRMLASRGPAYKTEKSADFQAHDSCACSAEPFYRGDGPSEQATEYARQWREAQQHARETDTGSKGTANDALNNFRRYLSGGGTADASPVTDGSPGQ